VGVGVEVLVAVAVFVEVDVGVEVGVGVAVAVGVAVFVAVGVAVGNAVALRMALNSDVLPAGSVAMEVIFSPTPTVAERVWVNVALQPASVVTST
jgi:hypothetical protein